MSAYVLPAEQTCSDLRITSDWCPRAEELRPLWLALQRRAQQQGTASFFTSWTWIETWLLTLDPRSRPQLWQAHDAQGCLIGLAILVQRCQWRLGFIPVQTGYLHETGLSDCDEITIEYNGILAAEGDLPAVTTAMVQAMMANGLDQLELSGVGHVPALDSTPLRVEVVSKPSFQVNLDAMARSGNDYLSTLTQRPRYLVRKSLKKLAENGPLRIAVAQSLEEARDYLAALIRLHNQDWTSRGEPGAFHTHFQQAFHQRIVATGFERSEVMLMAVLLANEPIAYFYFYCADGWAHFYQSGIDYKRFTSNESPGLAAHALAVEFLREQGLAVYDFMAGDVQYKRTLATQSSQLHWVTVSRPNVKLAAWRGLRRLGRAARARWLKSTAPAKPPAAPTTDLPAPASNERKPRTQL